MVKPFGRCTGLFVSKTRVAANSSLSMNSRAIAKVNLFARRFNQIEDNNSSGDDKLDEQRFQGYLSDGSCPSSKHLGQLGLFYN